MDITERFLKYTQFDTQSSCFDVLGTVCDSSLDCVSNCVYLRNLSVISIVGYY